MTTIVTLARSLDTTPEAIAAIAGQISDDPDLWDAESETLTDAGVAVVTGQHAQPSGLDDLAETIDQLAAVREAEADLLDQRDAHVRAALADGVPYARLGEITGLSRGALDAIRRGERSGRR